MTEHVPPFLYDRPITEDAGGIATLGLCFLAAQAALMALGAWKAIDLLLAVIR